MNTKMEKFIFICAITLITALITSTGYAADAVITTKSFSTTIDTSRTSGVDSTTATSNYSAIADVVEPPAPIDDYAGHDDGKPPTTAPIFEFEDQGEVNTDWMGAYISSVLQDQVVGYAYVINKEGQIVKSGAEGFARTPDDGNIAMSINSRSFIASVTKQITAIATIKILHDAGLSIDTPINNYLPDEWNSGTDFSNLGNLTFRHLMTHTTGWGQYFDLIKAFDDTYSLDNWGNDWDGLQFVVSNGASPGATSSYKNANYALLRVLLPEIWVQMGAAPYTEVTKKNHGSMFLAYIQQNIFIPIGINNVTCWVQPGYEEALAYSKDFVEQGGHAFELSIYDCGGNSGLRLSAYELARYLAYLRHGEEIISAQQLNLANQNLLGWDNTDGDGMYWKGGGYYADYVIELENELDELGLATQSSVEFTKSSYACVMTFPYGYEASIVINSEFKTGFTSSKCGVLKDAFEFAVSK